MTTVCRADENTSAASLRAAAQRIHEVLDELGSSARLVRPGEVGLGEVLMPVDILAVISDVLKKMSRGSEPGVMVLDDPDELTAEQAARLLGVSRPHLNQLLEVEGVEYRRLSDSARSHRRIPRKALLDLKARRERSHQRMDELMRLSEEVAD